MRMRDTPAPYGYCPTCGGLGRSRERRLNGDDRCENGHTYPSSKALNSGEILNPGHAATIQPYTPEMQAEVEQLRKKLEKVEADYAFVVARLADQRLEGYRELGARAAEAEHEAYLLRVRLRQTAQILIDAIGADGPMDAEEAAKKLVLRFELLESLLKELVALFGWSDDTPLHAVLHIRNAVSNMQVDTRLSERAAIVAWLRAKAAAWGTEGSMGYAADLIEAGEHR